MNKLTVDFIDVSEANNLTKIVEKCSTSQPASVHFWQNIALHANNSISFELF